MSFLVVKTITLPKGGNAPFPMKNSRTHPHWGGDTRCQTSLPCGLWLLDPRGLRPLDSNSLPRSRRHNRNFFIRACVSLYPPVTDCQETGICTKHNAHMKYGTTFTYHYRVENSNFSTLILYTTCVTPSIHGQK